MCLVMALVWGTNMPIVKIALEEFSPLSFNALRLVLAAGLLWVFARSLGEYTPIDRRDLGKIAVLGLVGNTAYQIFFIYGLYWTKAGNVGLILSGTTMLTALLSRALGHERLGRLVWVGILISMGGVFLILVESAEFSMGVGTLKGDLFILGASVCWAFYTVLCKPLMGRYSPLSITAATLSIGGTAFFLLSLPWLFNQNWSAVSLDGYTRLSYSFVFALALGYALWFKAIDRLGSTRTSIYGNLIPFVGLLASWWFLAEKVTPFQLAGGGLILLGISLTRQGRPPDSPAAIRQRQY